MDPRLCSPIYVLPFSNKVLFFINSSRPRENSSRWSLLIFDRQFPMLLLYVCSRQPQMGGEEGGGVVTKNKIDDPRFIDEEDIPLIQDEDYDDYNTLNAS